MIEFAWYFCDKDNPFVVQIVCFLFGGVILFLKNPVFPFKAFHMLLIFITKLYKLFKFIFNISKFAFYIQISFSLFLYFLQHYPHLLLFSSQLLHQVSCSIRRCLRYLGLKSVYNDVFFGELEFKALYLYWILILCLQLFYYWFILFYLML